jgi:predicted amidohydrolase YtcJ
VTQASTPTSHAAEPTLARKALSDSTSRADGVELLASRIADTVFLNGPVFTVDASRSWTNAVAVKDGIISAIGDTDVREWIGVGTDVVDLEGRFLLPGFTDAHVHPFMGGLERARCDLVSAASAEECLELVAAYAARNRTHEWITGGGWTFKYFPGHSPRKEMLDAIIPDRPVYLLNSDHHDVWVNSAALELAGITRETPDPPHGRIARDPDGTPTGVLHERAAALFAECLPTTTQSDLLAALQDAQAHLHSLGITGWQDAIVGEYLGYPDTLDAYRNASASGLLTARVTGALWWDPHRGEEQIADLVRRRALAPEGRFAATSVKIMQDGVCENLTAALLEPYHGSTEHGHSYVEPDALKRYITLLDREGFQVHVHAIGDRGMREALDAFEEAREANGTSDLRHHIAHVQLIHPADIPRFRRLGVAANLQLLWAAADSSAGVVTAAVLGEARARQQYPFGELQASGAMLAAGSDWPVSSGDPMLAIHVAVNRLLPGASGGRTNAEQKLTLSDAIAAYTIGSAWVCHREDTTGSIEIGKFADLAVLDGNPFAVDSSEIASIGVVETYVGGERVHG